MSNFVFCYENEITDHINHCRTDCIDAAGRMQWIVLRRKSRWDSGIWTKSWFLLVFCTWVRTESAQTDEFNEYSPLPDYGKTQHRQQDNHASCIREIWKNSYNTITRPFTDHIRSASYGASGRFRPPCLPQETPYLDFSILISFLPVTPVIGHVLVATP